jgi:hypothetical protein
MIIAGRRRRLIITNANSHHIESQNTGCVMAERSLERMNIEQVPLFFSGEDTSLEDALTVIDEFDLLPNSRTS